MSANVLHLPGDLASNLIDGFMHLFQRLEEGIELRSVHAAMKLQRRFDLFPQLTSQRAQHDDKRHEVCRVQLVQGDCRYGPINLREDLLIEVLFALSNVAYGLAIWDFFDDVRNRVLGGFCDILNRLPKRLAGMLTVCPLQPDARVPCPPDGNHRCHRLDPAGQCRMSFDPLQDAIHA